MGGLFNMGNVKSEVLKAYYDMNSNVSFEEASGVRDLDFLASKPVSVDWAKQIMGEAVPRGYNQFDADYSITKVASFFEDCEIIIARESSVCLYVIGDLNDSAYEFLSDDGSLMAPKIGRADEYSAESGEDFIRRIESRQGRRNSQELSSDVRKTVKGKTVHRFWWD